MDIRTLLTETKPFPPKRKADAMSSNPTNCETSPNFTGNSSSAQNTSCGIPSSGAPPINLVKKVKFTLNPAAMALGPRSFYLNINPTDPPNAITATVKDFFALHNCGVSFTDMNGSILIITADNLADDMEVIVNHTGIAEPENKNKKRRKSILSSRKRARKASVGKEVAEQEAEEEFEEEEHESEGGRVEHQEKRDKLFSSDVSIDNILDSSRRRLSKFSSENLPLIPQTKSTPSTKSSRNPRKTLPIVLTFPREPGFGNTSFPTPASTSASVISDEDVAIQLMRLTDPLATPILSPTILEAEPDIKPSQADSSQPPQTEHEHTRCTRCISSKKGCDRKRPCGRCVQQGFEESECKSDDERGTARKKVAALRRSTMMGRTAGKSRKASALP